jgi:hypothetical protein
MSKKIRTYIDADIQDYLTDKEFNILVNLCKTDTFASKLVNNNGDVLYYCISDCELHYIIQDIDNLSQEEQDVILKIKKEYDNGYLAENYKTHIRYFRVYV